MKKWLVGLMAASLCAASAWATDYTLVESTDDLTAGSYVITANNATDGAEPAMLAQAPDKNYFYPESVSVSEKVISDPKDTLVWELEEVSGGWSIHSDVGYVSYSGSGNTANAANDVSDGSTWTISIADGVATVLNKGVTDRKLQYNSGSPRFACYTSNQKLLKFYKAAGGTPPAFSIKLEPAEAFEVVQNKDASITATVKGAQGDVTYSWSVNGTPIELAGNVYSIDSSEVDGPFEVVCEASDGVSDPVSASVSYSVVAAPVITGDDYTLVSSADSLKDGTLVVLTDPDSANALKAAVASSVFSVAAVADNVSGDVLTTDDASIVWKLVDDGSGNFSLYNEGAAKYAGHAGTDSNSGRLQDDAFPNIIAVGEDGLFVFTAVSADAKGAFRTLQYNYNGGNARFAYYKGTQKNLRVYAAETGPAEPKVTFSGETTVEVGGTFELQFTLKNYEGDYSWIVEGGAGSISAEGVFTYAPAEAGVTVIVVKALDGEGEVIAQSIDIQLTANVPAAKYTVSVADGILNGTVQLSIGGSIVDDPVEVTAGTEVTVVATAAAGYKLGAIFVNGTENPGNTFVVEGETLVTAEFVESTGTVFTLITSVDDLEDGAEYVITDNTQAYAITAELSTSSTKRLVSTSVAPVDGVITTDDAAIVWKLVKDADGNFALYSDSIAKFIGWSSGNSAKFQDDAFANTISYESDLFVVMATSTAELDKPRKLQFNSAANTLQFAYYEGAQKNLSFFKAGGSAMLSVGFDQENPLKVDVGTAASVTAVAKGGEAPYAYAWKSETAELNGTEATLAIPNTLSVGTYTATVTVTDNAGTEVNKPFGIIVSEPAVAHDVNIAVGIQGGVVTADPDKATVGEKVTLTATAESGKKLVSMTVTYGETTLTFTSSPAEFEMPDADVYVGATFEEVTGQAFTLITSVDDLEDGAEYVITDNTQAYAIQAALSDTSSKRLLSTSVAPVDGVITTDDAAIIWKLVKDDDGNFALYNDSIKKYIGWSSGNSAKFQDDAFANTISYESDLFEVMATSTAELEKPRKLQFNAAANVLQFAYYEGAQKNLCFFKGGEPKPSISYTGATEVTIPDSFSIQFTLKNYDGSFTWVNDGREGGSIDAATGLYTWTPSDPDEVTITVKAMNGETEIASKSVALTVKKGEEPPPPSVTLTCEPASVTMAVGGSAEVTVTLKEGDTVVDLGSDYYIYFEDDVNVWSDENPATFDLADLGLEAGTYELAIVAGNFGDVELARTTLTVTVGEGPGPQPGEQPVITSIDVDVPGSQVTLTFTGDGSAVQGTDNLTANDWANVDGASFGEGTVTVPMGKHYLRIRQ